MKFSLSSSFARLTLFVLMAVFLRDHRWPSGSFERRNRGLQWLAALRSARDERLDAVIPPHIGGICWRFDALSALPRLAGCA